MTADDLRDRCVAAILRAGGGESVGPHTAADAVLAELGEDPGDLRERMRLTLTADACPGDDCQLADGKCQSEHPIALIGTRRLPGGDEFAVTGVILGTTDAIADRASSVRWEHAARQSAELEWLRALTATCTCLPPPDTNGPEADCPVHGAIRGMAEAHAEVAALQQELAEAKRQAQGYRSMKDAYLRERNSAHADLIKAEQIIERLCDDREAGQRIVKAAITEQRQRAEQAEAERDHWKREHDELMVVWQILGERAGKDHNVTGPVMACLAELLTEWERLRSMRPPGDRHPLEALAAVNCTHTRHYTMCTQCAADAMRPELERIMTEQWRYGGIIPTAAESPQDAREETGR